MTEKKRIYIKPQLCKEFDISERTLSFLSELDLLDLKWDTRNGLRVVELKERDKKVLSCAKNCLYNKIGFRLPFLRYLWLRFMQMPLDLIEFELAEKNLLDLRNYDNKFLQRRYDQFLAGIPEGLQECVRSYSPPNTNKEKELFDILLDVCEIRLAYEHPEWEKEFAFMNDPNTKTVIDCMLSTTGTYDDISKVLFELIGVGFNPEGLMFYQQLMHDMSLMDKDDIKSYFKGVAPSRRVELQKAYGQSLEVYKLQSGLQTNIKTQEVVEAALSQVGQRVLELTANVGAADANEVYQALRAFNILQDRHGKVIDVAKGTESKDVSDFFKRLEFAPQEVEDAVIEIPDSVKV